MKLLYITDVSQVQYFLKNREEFEGYMPITGDISSVFLMQNNLLEFINEWDLLPPTVIEQNWNLANDFSKNWWNEVDFDIPNDVKEYYFATSQDMVYPLEAIFNAKLVYEELFKKFKIEELLGFFLQKQAVLRTGPIPTHRAVRSIAQAILLWIADKNSVPYKSIEMNFLLTNDKLVK